MIISKGSLICFLSFKDPIENDQIPTPIWCDEKWTEKFLNDVQNGMGTIMLHASLTDYTENHAILTNVVRSNFITHPKKCPLTVKPIAEHPIIEDIGEFTFPDFDEHYVMEMIPNTDTTILAETVSNGPLMVPMAKGKICYFPLTNLTYNTIFNLKNVCWVFMEGFFCLINTPLSIFGGLFLGEKLHLFSFLSIENFYKDIINSICISSLH